jgi:TonB family protein
MRNASFILAMFLATTAVGSPEGDDPSDYFNPKFWSPDGEVSLVIRRYPTVGDFERVTSDAYWKRDPIEEWLDEYPLVGTKRDEKSEPTRGALYRRLPSGNQELLSEVTFRPEESFEKALVADDGHFVTYGSLGCGARSELLTIRAEDGSIVRTLLVRDVVTRNDQQWLCRGPEDDVRFSIHDNLGVPKLRVTMLVTEGKWDDAEARHATREIDLATGVNRLPDRDLCPAAILVVAEADDGLAPRRTFLSIGEKDAFDADDVVPIASAALLERAVTRVIPEYPEVAVKARIAGRVRVEVVVDRNGKVEAARIHPLPFGIEQAVSTAIMGWTFEPYPSAAEATRFSGSFIFRFDIVRPPPLQTTRTSSGAFIESGNQVR